MLAVAKVSHLFQILDVGFNNFTGGLGVPLSLLELGISLSAKSFDLRCFFEKSSSGRALLVHQRKVIYQQ